MRWLLTLVVLAATPAAAEIRSVDDCTAAIAADPAQAREDAALWQRLGGGVPASLCEADALAATGAHGTAAALLTNLAENPNRAIPGDARAVILTDAAGQWLAADRADLAAAALASADRLAPPDPARLLLAARIAAANEDWTTTRRLLETVVAREPGNALARALLAAALRHLDDPAGALIEAKNALALAPDLPEAQFETAAALAETGDTRAAADLWLRLIRDHPDSALAEPARANLQRVE